MALGDAAHAIITKGLTCGATTACQNGSMLTAGPFSLYCSPPPVIDPGNGGGGGGGYHPNVVSRPMQPGEIQHMYQPVPDAQQPYIVPRDQEAKFFQQKIPVKIEIKFAKINIEKEYLVPANKARVLFNTINIINSTKDRISASITGLRRISNNIIVKVKNFTIRRK